MGSNSWLRTDQARNLTVFFRRQSLDGAAGAWAIFAALPADLQVGLRALGGLFGGGGAPPSAARQARVGPVFQGAGPRPARTLLVGRRVVFVGHAPSVEELRRVAGAAASLTVLDHRRSSAARLDGLAGLGGPGAAPEIVLDRVRSAAQLAWDWAHGPGPRPAVIDYIADHDLFQFRQPNARAICRALATELREGGFGQLDALRRNPPSRRLRIRGALYLRREEQLVAQAAATARRGFLRTRPGPGGAPTYRVAAVNSPLLQSEIAEAVLHAAPPCVDLAMVWHVAPGGDAIWASLRTARPGLDLAALAERVLGAVSGGGTARVAGFVAPGADVGVVLAPEWRRPPGRAPKIEAGGRRIMMAGEFNLRLLNQLADQGEIPFAEYLIEFGRFAQKPLFPVADRMQELAERKGLVVSEEAFGDFGIHAPVTALIERAGLAEGKDFSVRPSPPGGGPGERVFSAEAFKRCLLRDEGAGRVVDYFLCVEAAAAAYGAYMQELAHRRRKEAHAPEARRPEPAQLGGLPARRPPRAGARAPAPPSPSSPPSPPPTRAATPG
ncbi:MAG TPA: hypothetical protein VNI01_14240 [Elusimicrobiota bacterium]|jgi:hypothetical protein|nr:hypothetical protein [Elusimicrobiota bacterium]